MLDGKEHGFLKSFWDGRPGRKAFECLYWVKESHETKNHHRIYRNQRNARTDWLQAKTNNAHGITNRISIQSTIGKVWQVESKMKTIIAFFVAAAFVIGCEADAQQAKLFTQSYVRYAGGRVYDFRNIVSLVSDINSLNGVSSSSAMARKPESIDQWNRELDYLWDENGPDFSRPAPSVANNRLRSLVIQNEGWNSYRVNGSPVSLSDGKLLFRLTHFRGRKVRRGLPPFSQDLGHIEYEEQWTYVVIRNYPQGPGYYPANNPDPFELLAIPTASKQGFNLQLPAGPNGVLSGSFPANFQFQVYDYGIPCDFSSSRTNELLLEAAKTNKYLRQFIPIADTNTVKQVSK